MYLFEIWGRFFEHLPADGDLSLVVLKGHLLVEEELVRVVESAFRYPDAIREGNFAFFKMAKIAMAIHYRDEMQWFWDALFKLNSIRNKYAHNLEPAAVNEVLAQLVGAVEAKFGNRETDFHKRLQRAIGMILISLHDLRVRGEGPLYD